MFELGYTQPPNTTISAKDSSDALFARQRAFDDIVSQQRQALALFETQAKLCAKNMPNGGSDLKYMGTPSVVRDIAFMTDVLDGPDAKMYVLRAIFMSMARSHRTHLKKLLGRIIWSTLR